MSRAARVALTLATCIVFGAVGAHAYLDRVEPAVDGVLGGAPGELTLRFSMAVEGRFSTFEVHRLQAPPEAHPVDLAAPSDRERQRLNALAAQLAASVLAGERDDDPERVDDGSVALADGNTVVTLGLRDDLPSGVYVLVWEVLAIDTHWTSGHVLLFVDATSD